MLLSDKLIVLILIRYFFSIILYIFFYIFVL